MQRTPALYNLENIDEIYQSNQDIISQIVQVFVDNIPKNVAELTEACKRKDWPSVSFIAHKLKSNIKLFNIHSATDDIIAIEMDAKSAANLDALPTKIENVSRIISAVVNAMKKKFRGK